MLFEVPNSLMFLNLPFYVSFNAKNCPIVIPSTVDVPSIWSLNVSSVSPSAPVLAS